MIGGFRSDLSITRKTDGNFGNVSASVLFSNFVEGRGSRVPCRGSRVEGRGSRVEGRGSRVEGRGSRVEGIFYKRLCYSEKDN